MEKIVIIGGGIGGAIAHDLALRGFRLSCWKKASRAAVVRGDTMASCTAAPAMRCMMSQRRLSA